jgi:hypothetical protein
MIIKRKFLPPWKIADDAGLPNPATPSDPADGEVTLLKE